MRKIAVITGTRAEYGLLYRTMKRIQASEKLKLQLIVTGMHLAPQYGLTYRQIEEDGFTIDKKVEMIVSGSTPEAVAKSMGLCMLGFAEVYGTLKPDMVLVLGDRYEILAAVSAALPFNIPIAHIGGGEITEGAIDEQIRHGITKMAHIHFPCANPYAENVQKMGEEAWRIFNTGHPGLENIKLTEPIYRETLFRTLNIDGDKKTFLVTLHPTTLNSRSREEQEADIFFRVLKEQRDVNLVITYPNSDPNSDVIVSKIHEISHLENVRTFENLGSLKYLSLMRECDLVLGNSSSSLIEAPFLNVPVIDFGDRQKGRLKAENIISVAADEMELRQAIKKAAGDPSFMEQVRNTKSLYGIGETSKEIVKVLENIPLDQRLIRKKLIFY
ncbi:MAG: UDP-N-acetylglucosamine 2-epimerase [Clostridia bacterium]|nr:UDP-N-acetylglucosamine 2-epimerase [Clostridia bacterium]